MAMTPEERQARCRAQAMASYHAHKNDPAWRARRKACESARRKRLRASDPAWRDRVNAQNRRFRAENPERCRQYEESYFAKKGITRSEYRRQLRDRRPDLTRARNARSNERRLCSARAAFARGDITFDELNRRVSAHVARCDAGSAAVGERGRKRSESA